MLNDADFSRFHRVYVCVGRSDLRKGIDGLATLVKQKFGLDPFQSGDLFLFCGSSNRKIKGLVWEGMVSFLSTKDWKQDPFTGREIRKKPAVLLQSSSSI